VLGSLRQHRDLGVHTELLSDGVIGLVDRGVITGTHKQLPPQKIVATVALGTQRLYGWMHDNGAVEMLSVDYVNDPHTIARERDFVSINATTEVDLMGLVGRRACSRLGQMAGSHHRRGAISSCIFCGP
jgi:acyl-CoA hydrolase